MCSGLMSFLFGYSVLFVRYFAVFGMACQNDIYSTLKISCNFQNIIQLC